MTTILDTVNYERWTGSTKSHQRLQPAEFKQIFDDNGLLGRSIWLLDGYSK